MPLTKQETEEVKGGYVFTCEEKKRNVMLVTAYTDSGTLVNTYKIVDSQLSTFLSIYNGTKTKL